jgi:hypothetical protein
MVLNSRQCLTPRCSGPQSFHGLCPKCWGKAKKLIEAGKTSLAELQKLGLAEAEQDPFEQELEKRRKEQA